jgi:hypothetical protein
MNDDTERADASGDENAAETAGEEAMRVEDGGPRAEEVAMSVEEGALSGEELAAVRELALRAYPETVPELVGGESVAALLASLEPAAAAYRRIAEGVSASAPAVAVVAPAVPAGSAPPVSIDPDRLPATEKIRRGLAHGGGAGGATSRRG